MTEDDLRALVDLKSRYCRFVDTKDFDALAELMTEDVTVAYQDGAFTLQGRDKVRRFLAGVMSDPGISSLHLVANPELCVEGDVATGRWALQDTVVNRTAGTVLRGGAHYEDRYVRTADGWKIAHTGYRRLFEEHSPLSPQHAS